MSDKAAEIVRRCHEAFSAGDLDLFTTLSSDDLTWETPGQSPLAWLRKGREAVYGQYGTCLGGTEFVSAGEDGKVVGAHRNSGARHGRKLDKMRCITVEVKDGKIVSGKEHFFDLYNWDAFWA